MRLIYNLFIRFYAFSATLAAFRSVKAKSFIEGRKNWQRHLKSNISLDSDKVWIHVASLGEYEQALPVLEKLNQNYPEYQIILTFFSPSGFENAKLPDFIKHKFYLPFDTPANSKSFLNIVNPKLILFVKYDIWYNFLTEAKQRNIPSILFSALFRKDQIYFSSYGQLMLKAIKSFDKIYVQNYSSQLLLKDVFVDSEITGDTRYDRVKGRLNNLKIHPFIKDFSDGENVIVVGSCWPDDLEIIMPYLNSLKHTKVIFAPHNIKESEISALEEKLKITFKRFSQLSDSKDIKDINALIIDNIGMLATLYSVGDIAYVGGAFHGSLHNILEPAIFGLPVIFGSNHKKFPEAQDMVDYGCAFSITGSEEFSALMMKLDNLEYRKGIGVKSKDFVLSNLGSSDKIMDGIKEILSGRHHAGS